MKTHDYLSQDDAIAIVRKRFENAGLVLVDVAATAFPEETVILAKVAEDQFERALRLGPELDRELAQLGFDGFVTIRAVPKLEVRTEPVRQGVHDSRIPGLMELLATRSRASETHPSLTYVPDAAAHASLITTPRHHLVFGRRGAGKTALLLEGKRVAEEQGSVVTWSNIQTFRDATARMVYLWVINDLLGQIEVQVRTDERAKALLSMTEDLRHRAIAAVNRGDEKEASKLVPSISQLLSRFGETTGSRTFVFLDDFHYLARSEQPTLLDLLHRSVRDSDVWLKVAAIKHLTRWFDSKNHLGLETGHDANHIELDLTLQNPERAKKFLEEVLRGYGSQAGITAMSRVFSNETLDRLVLASGAVPRDYLTLAGHAIQRCRARANSKVVGVQDVNAAAGDAAKVKIDELEDDLASSTEARNSTLEGLRIVRAFCLDEKSATYFRVNFRDKETKSDEYRILTSLLDVRLLHLLDPSLSDPHHAGERSEVYVLDLSQYSGQRLKHHLRVLDLEHGRFVSRETRKAGRRAVGDTPLKLITIFRGGPEFALERLTEVA